MASSLGPMRIEDIGFGRVNRRITIGGELKARGDELSHEALAAMKTANRNALIENRIISVFPKFVRVNNGGLGSAGPALSVVEGEHHVVAKGFGKYDVIKGVVLQSGVTREAAAAFVAGEIARAPEPASRAATGPANAGPKASRRGSGKGKSGGRGRRGGKRRPVPAPDDQQPNGPLDDIPGTGT